MGEADRVREVVLASLRQLVAGLAEFDQTTHGCLFRDPGDAARRLGPALAEAMAVPSAFNISTLSQCAEAVIGEQRVS